MVTFQYEGKLTSVDNELSSEFSGGDTFKGTYTFDTTVPRNNLNGSWDNVISAASFVRGDYTVSSTNGSIFAGIDGHFATIDQVSGQPVKGYLPSFIGVHWVSDILLVTGEGDLRGDNLGDGIVFLLGEPRYDPNLRVDIRDFEGALQGGIYADADGNIIEDFDAYYRDDPNRPVFFSRLSGLSGQPVGLNGTFNFSFINEDQSRASIKGELTFVTVVPIPAAVWLFGTGLLGLFGFTKHKQMS